MNKKIIVAIALVAVVGAAVAGGAFWYLSKGGDHAEEQADGKADGKAGKKVVKKEEKKKEGPPKYLTVDKVIIMLKRAPGDTGAHYMSADLVITADEKTAAQAKEHLPMLRSVAVRTLSNLPLATAQTMTIDQFAAELNKAFDEAYERDGMEKPFSEVMIGKLIIE